MKHGFMLTDESPKRLGVVTARGKKFKYAQYENDVLERTLTDGVEYCHMVDSTNGVSLGLIKGEFDKCPLESYKKSLTESSRLINIHTHTNHTAHSSNDLYLLLTQDWIAEVRVVTADRTYFAKFDDINSIELKDFHEISMEIKKGLEADGYNGPYMIHERNKIISELFDIIYAEELA